MKNFIYRMTFMFTFFIFGRGSFAQCPPPGDLEFFHQSDLNEFIIRYPLCDEIKGHLRLYGPDIFDLTPLSNIKKIHGDLVIYETAVSSFTGLNSLKQVVQNVIIRLNHSVTNMSGFNQLFITGGFELRSNFSLNSLTGLESLQFVNNAMMIFGSSDLVNLNGLNNLRYTHSLVIANNSGLTSLNGLENLKYIADLLAINNNRGLTNVSGLHNLEYTGILQVMDCAGITNLHGLQSLLTINHSIVLINNPILEDISSISRASINNPELLDIGFNTRLSNCSIENICAKFSEFHFINVGGNNVNCNSRDEIRENCFVGRSRMSQNPIEPFEVYPNPNDGYFRFGGLPNNSLPSKLEIFSSDGKLIFEQEIKDNSFIDFRNNPSGIYTLVTKNENSTIISKMIKN